MWQEDNILVNTDCQERMKELVTAQCGEKFLEPKTFPHLFPWGFGGWYHHCPMKLYDVRGWWAHDSAYRFFKYDQEKYVTCVCLYGAQIFK